MNWTLEVVVVPVTDIDRAKAFYADGLGFHVDHDLHTGGGRRLVQLTPPGSGCSIVLGPQPAHMLPGSLQGVQLVVNDLRAAREELLARGVDVPEIQILGGPPRPATPDDDLNHVGFLFLRDPDGNGWAVQQISARP
ncbi:MULTISPECIES: VOC family protein [Deinococcus]|uniref:VOC family protein n=1 Tax=Deinococcus rufus TaxID=2136097 RepID=A0ABV7Z647_9DEIO|nr:VOC family protein [Deinococcus sp. AB2017081]WQE95472.1 VOC family protein [Deinococcus sp. AB2017081]